MPRLRQVPRAELAPELDATFQMVFGDRDPVAEPGTTMGTPGDWFPVFALVPDVFQAALASLHLGHRPDTISPPELLQLAIVRAGWVRGSQFVYSQHCKVAREVGIADDKIAAIVSWEVSEAFSPIERAVLAYTDALVERGGRVPDPVFDALRAELTDEQILELTYVAATYEMHAAISVALRLEYDDRDEPIVEVPAPGEDQSFRW